MTLRLIFSLLAVAFLYGSSPLMAQKARFKNAKASCQKTRLPSNYVEPENRTYDLFVKGQYSDNVEAYNKGIYGWTLDTESPNVEAVLSLYGFEVNPAKRASQKKQTKDKEGNVTASWTEYTYSGSATGYGTLYVYGQNNPFKYEKPDAEKSKAELAREAQEAEKKKELEANPFLSADDVADSEDAGESDISEDTGLDNAMLPLVSTVKLNIGKSVKTKPNRSISKAYEDYRNNHRPKLYSLKNSYPNASYNKAISNLNARYGYSPVKYTVWLKNMRSDKHPEFKMWNDATAAAQTLFKSMRYNKSIDATQGKFTPIVGYFTDKVAAIDDKDRKQKNMKKAAFTNATNLLFYLDQHDELIALCEQYADSKYVGKAAKKMMSTAHRQKALLAFHKMATCHVEKAADIEEGDIEIEEVETEAEPEAEGSNR